MMNSLEYRKHIDDCNARYAKKLEPIYWRQIILDCVLLIVMGLAFGILIGTAI